MDKEGNILNRNIAEGRKYFARRHSEREIFRKKIVVREGGI